VKRITKSPKTEVPEEGTLNKRNSFEAFAPGCFVAIPRVTRHSGRWLAITVRAAVEPETMAVLFGAGESAIGVRISTPSGWLNVGGITPMIVWLSPFSVTERPRMFGSPA
jgi:hypothetical protein